MNYIYGSILTAVGVLFLKNGIESFANLNIDTKLLFGGNKDNKFSYSENKRLNFNFGKYPPCFNYSVEARHIFDTIDMKGEINKYQRLFDVYSILLCQKYHASYKECDSDMLKERINDLKKMMPQNYDKNLLLEKISKYVILNDSNVFKLILMSFYLIEEEIKKIKDDKIINLNDKFYYAVFQELLLLCDKF